jgi:type VI protein secretion system component VasK
MARPRLDRCAHCVSAPALMLCLLIWYGSPLLAFGHQPVSARLTAIALVLAAFALYGVLRLRQKMREDTQFLKKLLYFGSKEEPSPAESVAECRWLCIWRPLL